MSRARSNHGLRGIAASSSDACRTRPTVVYAPFARHDGGRLLPGVFDLDEMGRDLASHDALNERLTRLLQLVEKVRDTDTALGSDVMVAALAGYHFLKVAGKGEGLDAVNRDMGKRFGENGSRAASPQPVQA